MLRPTLFLCSFVFLACAGGSLSDSADTADTADTAGDDRAHPGGGVRGGDDDTGFVLLDDPCGGEGTPEAMLFTSAEDGYVGCGNGIGLYHTSDGGLTWDLAHESGSLYVSALSMDPEGRLLLCGRDYERSSHDALLYRLEDGQWTRLLGYGNDGDDDVQMSGCGAVAAAGDGTLVVASATAGDLAFSTDDGATWTETERYWEDANLEDGGYAYYYLLELVSAGGGYYGGGSRITEPPVFFGPTTQTNGDWTNLHAWTIDEDLTGEVWALATPDDGSTWFAGGRDQGATRRASGFLYRSTDGGESWTELGLPDGVDIMQDIAFAEDGLHGVAVGHRYPTSDGGYVLLTSDGGDTWDLLDQDLPLLQSAAASGDAFYVAGDYYAARGSW